MIEGRREKRKEKGEKEKKKTHLLACFLKVNK